jgi:hypothetical protein
MWCGAQQPTNEYCNARHIHDYHPWVLVVFKLQKSQSSRNTSALQGMRNIDGIAFLGRQKAASWRFVMCLYVVIKIRRTNVLFDER